MRQTTQRNSFYIGQKHQVVRSFALSLLGRRCLNQRERHEANVLHEATVQRTPVLQTTGSYLSYLLLVLLYLLQLWPCQSNLKTVMQNDCVRL